MEKQVERTNLCAYENENNLPYVTAVIPMLNEAEYIANCLQSLFVQNYPQDLLEVIVVDGGSQDGSVEIVREFVQKHPSIRLLGGLGLNCPAAMNVGILNLDPRSQIIVKVDAHGYIDQEFISAGVRNLLTHQDIKCVGGPIKPVPKSRIQASNAIARSSIFGVGGGTYTYSDRVQFVDSVQCGIYDKKVLIEVGMFDELLQFGEDEEVNWRIRLSGYKILNTPEVKYYYFPRPSFRGLFNQYKGYGDARVRVIKKHRDYLKLKHLIPFLFLVWLIVCAILALVSTQFAALLFVSVALYLFVSEIFSIKLSLQHGCWLITMLPISFACIHLGYGLGFGWGLIKELGIPILRRLDS